MPEPRTLPQYQVITYRVDMEQATPTQSPIVGSNGVMSSSYSYPINSQMVTGPYVLQEQLNKLFELGYEIYSEAECQDYVTYVMSLRDDAPQIEMQVQTGVGPELRAFKFKGRVSE